MKTADGDGIIDICNGIVSLPIYLDLKDNELEYICQTIKRILTE
jgi:dTDP-4-amino-4,6-dideoxygalactose transaminase